MRHRDITEEMVSIKGREWWVRAPCLWESNSKWYSLRQSLSSAFIASKSSKHSDWWQNVCSVYKTSHKWLRFHSLAVCFFWLLSGWRWNNDRKTASFGKISSLWTITPFAAVWGRHFAYFSHVNMCKVTVSIQISSSLHFLSLPFRSAAVCSAVFWDLRRWVVSVHLP